MRVGFEGLGRRGDGIVGVFGDEDSLKVMVKVVGIDRNLDEEDMVEGIKHPYMEKKKYFLLKP